MALLALTVGTTESGAVYSVHDYSAFRTLRFSLESFQEIASLVTIGTEMIKAAVKCQTYSLGTATM